MITEAPELAWASFHQFLTPKSFDTEELRLKAVEGLALRPGYFFVGVAFRDPCLGSRMWDFGLRA